jgi:hypothetical protein
MTHVWCVQSNDDFLLSYAIYDQIQSTLEEPPEPLSFTIDLIQLEDLTDPNLQNSPISFSIDLTLADFMDPTLKHDAQPQSVFLELHPLDEHLTPISEAALQSSTTELHD